MLNRLSLPSYFRIKYMNYLRRDFSNRANTGYDSSCRIFPDKEHFLRTYFFNNTEYTRKNDRIYVRNMCHTPSCVHKVMFFTSTSNFCHRPCVGLMSNIFRRSYNSINLENVPTLSLLQMKKTLKACGLAFDDGFTCLIMNCPMCTEINTGTSKAAQLQGKFYINKTTGMFVCHECGSSGEWETLEKILLSRKGKKASSSKEVEPIKKKSLVDQAVIDIQQNSQPLDSLLPDEQENILKKFNLPAVAPTSVSQFEILCNASRTVLYFPLYCANGQITGFRVLKNGDKLVEETTVPPTGCSGLLIPKPVKTGKQESAVLVPSVADVLALIGYKIGGQVAGLPHGITTLPLQVLPSLERYNKLILWFGDSIGSWDSARNFAKKLGEKRCFIVKATEKQPSPHVALRAGYDLRAIVNAAQPVWHQAIISFSMLRQDVLSDLQNIEKVQGVKWKRYPALNRILKGHRPGEFTVLTGPTGSGKTTFMSEYSLDLAMQGVNTLWGSFEIRNARLARTMLQQMAGIPLDVHIDQFDQWADQFEQLPLYFMTFHGQQSIKVVMEAVEHAAYVHDIAHVIIDNVQFMMGVSDEPRHADRFWKQDAIIACFRSFATRKNCHVTLVIHPRKERDEEDLTVNSIFGSAKAAQEADNVLIIQDKRLSSVRGKKYLQVAKNRYSGDLGIMTLDFDKDSLSYQQKKKKVIKTEREDMDHG